MIDIISACPKIRQNCHFEHSEKSYSLIVLALKISPFGRNFDAKRPVNIDILSRIDLKKLSEINGKLNKALEYLSYAQAAFSQQLALVFEKQREYRTKRST